MGFNSMGSLGGAKAQSSTSHKTKCLARSRPCAGYTSAGTMGTIAVAFLGSCGGSVLIAGTSKHRLGARWLLQRFERASKRQSRGDQAPTYLSVFHRRELRGIVQCTIF